jgi:hypothetical protein
MHDILTLVSASVLVAASAAAAVAADSVSPTLWAEYDTLKASTGPGAAAQVQMALWCEQHGLLAQRHQHLAKAVLIDPGNALARGLLGLMRHQGRWLEPATAAGLIRGDAAGNAALAEYNRRRDELDARDGALKDKPAAMNPATPARVVSAYRAEQDHNRAMDWLRLGLWCAHAGLADEAKVEFTTAVRMDPRIDDAWRHLGCVRFEGRWMPAAEAAAAAAAAKAQREADRTWESALRRWQVWLLNPAQKAEAEAQLARVTDPRAAGAVARVLSGDPERTIQLLRQINAPSSTALLAKGAVFDESEDFRSRALDLLKARPRDDYLKVLVDAIHTPAVHSVEAVQGPGSTGKLIVDTPRYHLERDYAAPGPFNFSSTFYGYVGYDVNGLPVAIPGRELRYGLTPEKLWWYEEETALLIEGARVNAQRTQQQILDDVARLERANERTRAANARAAAILQESFGAPELGDDDEIAWQRWYFDRVGYSYFPPEKVYITRAVESVSFTPTLFSCFAAGTLVQTLDGPRPIEQIRPADRVLSQDTATGALGFQPVLVAHHNPPCRTVRLTLEGGEVLLPSIYHRFWITGKGWVLARDLQAGDVLRKRGGRAKLAGVETGAEVPVFNLTVAGHHTFFVGQGECLVHDNTLPAKPTEPFDAATVASR